MRPIRLVVPTAPGGTSDVIGRILAQKLSEAFGQQMVVENRAGASTIIGLDFVAKSAPDGYTLGITQASIAINPSAFRKVPYEMHELAPISRIVEGPLMLSLHPSVPARSVKELIALAKANPGKLTHASPGFGTNPHVATTLLNVMAGIDILQVLYKGSGQGMIDVIAGEIALLYASPISVTQHIKTGRLRALAVTGKTRSQALPDVPAFAETLPGYEATAWFGVLAPAGTPRPIIDRLYREMSRVLRTPDMKERLAADGIEVLASTPEEFASFLKSETEKWARVFKAAGIKPE